MLTGATGMAGKGALHESLHHPAVAEVLVLTQKSYYFLQPKLEDIQELATS